MDDETKDIFFVKYNNIVVAGIIIIYSIDTAYFIQGCSDTQYLYLNPNDFLLHESIKVALEREKRYVDFLGTDKKLPSLIKFKDKFGTQKEELFNFYKDIGITKPFIWNIGYKFANTSFGAQVVNKILYLKECGFYL
jgi:lipid II:glycine glycyltransferase (peptidoglycan interpeptide bridge formation enzyme)